MLKQMSIIHIKYTVLSDVIADERVHIKYTVLSDVKAEEHNTHQVYCII